MQFPTRKACASQFIQTAALTMICCVAATVAHAAPTTLPDSGNGISITVDDATGAYGVTAQKSGWTFAGTIGGPLTHVATSDGADKLGGYREVKFDWQGPDGPLAGAIRSYNERPAVLWSVTTPQALTHGTPAFPNFTTLPAALHLFSYQDNTFSGPTFSRIKGSTPVLLFDDRAENTAILSPASDFFVSSMTGDGATALASGLNTQLTRVPAGFTHKTLLVFGNGPRETLARWGTTFTDLLDRKRPASDADLLLKYYGYWTDNGAHYYYNYDADKGYIGTLEDLVHKYRDEGIPIRYLQLDSWWYEKTRTAPNGKVGGPKNAKLPEGTWNAYGGTLVYRASPALFPEGLEAFHKKVDLPLVVHARWIDPESPYHKDYKISGIAPIDPKWWDETAAYLKANGVICYEQDWLVDLYQYSPEMASTLDTGDLFADNMARSAAQNDQTLQYCMGTPRFFLNGARYDNLTTIRVSGDRFERGKWNSFLYTSAFAEALGIWPWVDVFMSTETDNLLLATLSAGPVGTGDALGKESKENILKSVRADGRIVKPDAPITPSDAGFLADARKEHTPLVAWTYTDHVGGRTAYAFAFTRRDDTAAGTNPSFTPASLGITAPRAYIYDYFAGTGSVVDSTASYTAPLGPRGDVYDIVAPVGPSGIAFLGDLDQFVATGKQRIPELTDEPGKLTATVALAPREKSVTLTGYAPAPPTVTAEGGKADDVHYDAATQRFNVVVSHGRRDRQEMLGGDSVYLVKVVVTAGKP